MCPVWGIFFGMKSTIAIQGAKGSFHEIAAMQYFRKDINVLECETFPSFFKAMQTDKCNYGVMAIENSVVGTILSNYGLLKQSSLQIIGEIYLRIEHHLMALKGQSLPDIEQVKSHRMAILQCDEFLDKQPNLQIVNGTDTALIAAEIANNKIEKLAAIASRRAAEINGLDILAENIENNHRNFTRFLVLETKDENKALQFEGFNKTSMSFHVGHRPGTLAHVLSTFSYYQLNLSKIQSMPVVGEEWHYYFHIDVEYDDFEIIQQCLEGITPFINNLNILGIYNRGDKPS